MARLSVTRQALPAGAGDLRRDALPRARLPCAARSRRLRREYPGRAEGGKGLKGTGRSCHHRAHVACLSARLTACLAQSARENRKTSVVVAAESAYAFVVAHEECFRMALGEGKWGGVLRRAEQAAAPVSLDDPGRSSQRHRRRRPRRH